MQDTAQNSECKFFSDHQILRPGDQDYKKHKRSLFNGRVALLFSHLTKYIKRRFLYNEDDVRTRYDVVYGSEYFSDANMALNGKLNTYLLADEKLLRANSKDCSQFTTHHLINAVCALAPKNVMEIGSGAGRVTFAVASRLKNAKITGLELSQDGVNISLQMLNDKSSSSNYYKIYGVDFSKIAANELDFICASAKNIPRPDQSCDLVYTFMALEQTNSQADDVLDELVRVSSRYLVLLEPFWEANDLLGKISLILQGYWRKRISDIEKRGFRLVSFKSDLPRKISFHFALAVFERK